MIVYRVASNDNGIYNEKFEGVNTFKYEDNKDYLHFFILPENADIYKLLKYTNVHIDSTIYKCDIPYELIKDNFGIGLYTWYHPRIKSAFLECRIEKDKFKDEYIVDKSKESKISWRDKSIYNRYMKHCVSDKEPIESFDGKIVLLNPKFNFLHYFKKEDLDKEGIEVSDYPNEIVTVEENNNINKKYKFLNRIKKVLLDNKSKEDKGVKKL